MNKSEWKPLVNTYKKPMVTITFTKKDILKAIQFNNNISHGSFFRSETHSNIKLNIFQCDTDVIGAILQECVLTSEARGADGNAVGYALDIHGSIYHSVEEFLSKKQYLSALNTYFEIIDRDGRIDKSDIKTMVCEFIRKNFPSKFSMKLSAEYTSFLKKVK